MNVLKDLDSKVFTDYNGNYEVLQNYYPDF